MWVALCFMILVGCGVYLWVSRPAAPPDSAAEFRDIAPFASVYGAGGSWSARLEPGSAPAQPDQVCRALALRVRAFKPGSVTLLSDGGLPVARCP